MHRIFSRPVLGSLAALSALATLGALGTPTAIAAGETTSTHYQGSTYNSVQVVSYTTSDGRVVGSDVIRRNPCRGAIHYRVNAGQLGSGAASAIRDARYAVGRLQAATGYSFVYDGTTTAIPQKNSDGSIRGIDKNALVIAWAYPPGHAGSSNLLTPNTRALGEGGAHWDAAQYDDGTNHHYTPPSIDQGYVLLSTPANSHLTPGTNTTTRSVRRVQVLLHEMGHAMGLGHVTDAQVMNATVQPSTSSAYRAGDLAGLRKLDVHQPCQVDRVAYTG